MIFTQTAHFQRTYSKPRRQRGKGSCRPDLGQPCYSYCWCLSATCVCARPPSPQPACLIISHRAGCPQKLWEEGGKRQRGALSGQTCCWPSGKVKQTNTQIDSNKPVGHQTNHIQENTKMVLLFMSKNIIPLCNKSCLC